MFRLYHTREHEQTTVHNCIIRNIEQADGVLSQVDMEGPDMKQATEEGEEDSQDEHMDDIDVLMLQERLGLTLEQQLEDLEAKGLSSEDLNRLLALEGQRCCADTGLEVGIPAMNALHDSLQAVTAALLFMLRSSAMYS